MSIALKIIRHILPTMNDLIAIYGTRRKKWKVKNNKSANDKVHVYEQILRLNVNWLMAWERASDINEANEGNSSNGFNFKINKLSKKIN